MMIDENLIFITLVIVFFIFFVNKYPKLVGTLIIIIIVYIIYKKNFTNPRDFINYMKTTITEGFEPCSFNNQVYCGTDYNNSLNNSFTLVGLSTFFAKFSNKDFLVDLG